MQKKDNMGLESESELEDSLSATEKVPKAITMKKRTKSE